MKLNEFEVGEGKLSDMWTKVKTRAGELKTKVNNLINDPNDPDSGLSKPEKMGKQKFINDFVARAMSTLGSEIQSGRVDPATKTAEPASDKPPESEPTKQTTPEPAPAAPAAPEPQGQALDLDAYKKRREAEKAAGVQAQQAAQQQMKQTADANVAASAADTALVAKVKAEKQKPGFQQDKGLIRQAATKGIHETKYQKLNAIFESILLFEAESIGQFFARWLPTYMRNVNMSDPHTKSLIQKIEDTYAQDKGKAALTQLAHAAYAASYAPGYGAAAGGPTQGAQGDNANPQSGAQSGASGIAPAGNNNSKKITDQVRALLTQLSKSDPAAYASFVQELAKAAATPRA